MPVSYLSQNTLKADPYQIPMSLDLMAKVLSVKQEKFDTNARNIQQGINSIANTDIIKSQDKAYLNDKVNNLVTKSNEIGGQDLSDPNIANQIENLGSDIYGDEKVVNAMASTKAIRSLQSSYQQYKTDPKLNKMYSSANEWYDMQPVNQYLNNNETGSMYHGSANPTPYKDYKDKLFNNLKNVKATYEDKMTNNGLFYSKNSIERVSPERISQAAADLLTADEKGQLERDGLYAYKDLSKPQLIQKAHEVNQFKLSGAYATLQSYTDGYVQAANDPLAKKNYETLIDRQKKEIDAIQGTMDVKTYSDSFDKNPQGFQVQVYKDEFNRGLASTFAYTKTKENVVANTAAMFNLKMTQAERFHNDNMQLELAKANLKTGKDGKIIAGDPANSFTYIENNTTAADANKVTEATFSKRNDELSNDNTVATKSFFDNLALANPDLVEKTSSSMSGSGNQYKFKGQDLIENVNGQPGIQFDDFKNLVPGSSEYNDFVTKSHLSPNQVDRLYSFYDNYQKAATGKVQTDVKMPDGFTDLVTKLQLNNEAISANKVKVSNIDNTLATNAGITPAEMIVYKRAQEMNAKNSKIDNSKSYLNSLLTGYSAISSNGGLNNNELEYLKRNKPLLDRVDEKLKSAGYNKQKEDMYANISNKPFYPQMTLQGGFLGKMKEEDSKNLFSAILSQVGDVTNTLKPGTVVPSKNIELQGIGKQPDGTYALTAIVNTGTSDKPVHSQVKVALQPQNATQFGFYENPYKVLDESVSLKGRSNPLFVTSDIDRTSGRKLPLKASIVIRRLNNSREDISSVAEIVDENGKKLSEVPQSRAKSPSEAFALGKAYIQAANNKGMDYETMLQQAINDSYFQ